MTHKEHISSHIQEPPKIKPSEEACAQRDRYFAFEELPSTAIEDVIINTNFSDQHTDVRLSKYFRPDSLVRNTGYFGINRSEGAVCLPQAPTMNRGVVYEYSDVSPFVDEYGNCYSQVSGKGTGATTETMDIWNEDPTSPFFPIGLFGVSDAIKEMEISNHIARAGGRTGRVLGIIILNHDELSEWFQRFPIDVRILYNLHDQLEKVTENDDTAAICIRLLGAERVKDFLKVKQYNNHTFSRDELYSLPSMTERTASILTSEIDQRGEEPFLDRYGIPSGLNLRQALQRLKSGIYSKSDIDAFIQLNQSFYIHNLTTTAHVSQKYFEGNLAGDYTDHNIDLAGFWYDWELSNGKEPRYADMSETIITELFSSPDNS